MKRTLKRVANATFVAFGIVMFWRGVWGLADVYLLPDDYALSSLVSLLIGFLVLIMNRRMIKNFLYE